MAATKKETDKPVVISTPDPPVVPTPTFVPTDEFKQFQATITGQFNQFQDNFNAILAQLGSRKNDAPADPIIEDVTEEELEQVLNDGKGAGKIIKAMDAKIKKMEGAFNKRVQELESVGLNAISELSRDTAAGDMPYYSKYKKEIDTYVATLPAHLRVSKQVYVVAHNAVVGQHLPEIMKDEREKILREASNPEDASLPTGINGRDKNKAADEIPTVEDLLGKDAANALTSLGRTPDQQAQKLGYKDWATYATFIKKQDEEAQANG